MRVKKDILCQLTRLLPLFYNNLPKQARLDVGPYIALLLMSISMDKFIKNTGTLSVPDDSNIPDEYQFEILRLRRRIDELEDAVRNRDERTIRAISMLEDELQMWRTFMRDHVTETYDGIRRRIVRIDSTLMTLRESGNRIVAIPERWRES